MRQYHHAVMSSKGSSEPGRVSSAGFALSMLLLAAGVTGCNPSGPVENHESVIAREIKVSFDGDLLAERGAAARVSHELFDARMAQLPEGERAGFVSDPGRIGTVLDELLMADSIFADARNKGLLDDPNVQARLYFSLNQQVLREARQFVRRDAELPDYESRAREIYLSDPAEYTTEPVFSFTQILLDDGENGEQRASELLERHRNGIPLETLAIENSDDPSVERNDGVIEDVAASRLDGDFLAALEQMEVGDSGVVRTRYGWHVIRLDALVPERVKSFEEVAETLKGLARSRHLANAWERYLRKHSDGELKIAPNAVARILDRYPVEVPAESDDTPGDTSDDS